MAEKVTIMVLKVDLECPCCYKKVKKILCKFPQIRDQEFDEKGNKVTITVVCCNPEKIGDKLCCKGAKVIKSIEIKDPPKPKQLEKPKETEKPKEPEKPSVIVIEKPREPEKPIVVVEKPKEPQKPIVVVEKPKEAPKPDPSKIPDPAPGLPKTPDPDPVHGCPSIFPMQPTCCGPCSQGYGGGPCHYGYGVPPPLQPCYDGYYGYGCNGTHVSRCDYYFSEENPQSCSIM